MSAARRALHLNAFLMEAGHHEAAWRLAESNPRADFDLAHWIELAQLAENAKFDSLFLADGPALTGSGEFRPPGQLEPLTLLTALSQHTSRIGLIATVSSTYNEPYNLARRLASVDHVSGGRAGWNIVTSATPEEAANFGLDNRLDHSSRYARADEFLDVAKALWDSWETDAVLGDKSSGRYSDLARLHTIDHHGDHFKVAGPLNVERPPQGHPLLVQAGSSEDEKASPPVTRRPSSPPTKPTSAPPTSTVTSRRGRKLRVVIPMVCSCCRGSCRSSARLSAKPESGQGNWTNFACRSTGCGNWRTFWRPTLRRSSSTSRPPTSSYRARTWRAPRAVRTSSSSWRSARA
jgi:Luciferase-like monooxygenase